MSPNPRRPALPTDPDQLDTATLIAEQRAGYDAGWKGQPRTACPHKGSDADLRKQAAWIAGYNAARTDLRLNRKPG